MTDNELISELKRKTIELTHDKTYVMDPAHIHERTAQLCRAYCYLICAAILNNELPQEELERRMKGAYGLTDSCGEKEKK